MFVVFTSTVELFIIAVCVGKTPVTGNISLKLGKVRTSADGSIIFGTIVITT